MASKLVDDLLEVAGGDMTRKRAEDLIEMCHGDLNKAMLLHFSIVESDGKGNDASSSTSTSKSSSALLPRRHDVVDDDDHATYRPIVAPKNDVLIAPGMMRPTGWGGGMAVPGIMQNRGQPVAGFPGPSRQRTALQRLYDPPASALTGTLLEACDECVAHVPIKWLVVCIQDNSFASLCLSRDVWRNDMIKDIMGTGFALWLQTNVSPAGERFCRHYNVNSESLPAVYIVDPRTRGIASTQEQGRLQLENMCLWLSEFAEKNSRVLGNGTGTAGPREGSEQGAGARGDLDEEEQLKAAIQASLLSAKGESTRVVGGRHAGDSKDDDEDDDHDDDDDDYYYDDDNDDDDSDDVECGKDNGDGSNSDSECDLTKSSGVVRGQELQAHEYQKTRPRAARGHGAVTKRPRHIPTTTQARASPTASSSTGRKGEDVGPSPVPPEPPTPGEGVTQIMVRFPTSESCKRRFLMEHSVGQVMAFIESRGFPCSEFSMATHRPRRDLAGLGPNTTIQDARLQNTCIFVTKK